MQTLISGDFNPFSLCLSFSLCSSLPFPLPPTLLLFQTGFVTQSRLVSQVGHYWNVVV